MYKLESFVNSAGPFECARCLRGKSAESDYYEATSENGTNRWCKLCGDLYNEGCADTEAASEFRPYLAGPRFPCNCLHGNDPRHCKECLGPPEQAAKADEPKAVNLTDTGLSQRDRIEIAVELRMANTGIDWLDAWIRDSRRWEAVLAAMQGLSANERQVHLHRDELSRASFAIADAVLAEADKRSKPEPELAGTDEYPECGLCNTLLDPDDQSYCSNTHCQRYPGPEVVRARQEITAEADKRAASGSDAVRESFPCKGCGRDVVLVLDCRHCGVAHRVLLAGAEKREEGKEPDDGG